jgi:hypothetical protein
MHLGIEMAAMSAQDAVMLPRITFSIFMCVPLGVGVVCSDAASIFGPSSGLEVTINVGEDS